MIKQLTKAVSKLIFSFTSDFQNYQNSRNMHTCIFKQNMPVSTMHSSPQI